MGQPIWVPCGTRLHSPYGTLIGMFAGIFINVDDHKIYIHVIPSGLCGRLPDLNPISRMGNAISRIMNFAIMIFSQATIFMATGTLHF